MYRCGWCAGLPSLRTRKPYRAIRKAFAAGCEKFGFRLTQYSVQRDHLHLLVEAVERRGKVFSDRYHDRILRTANGSPRGSMSLLQSGGLTAGRRRRSPS